MGRMLKRDAFCLPPALGCYNHDRRLLGSALVAQWIERLASNQKVGGSIPSEGTTTRQTRCLLVYLPSGVGMRAHILSIGSELILGHITDTNATFLAQQLAGLGIELVLVTQVGDDLPRLTAAIRRATDDAEVVICTGGIGPTADDLTREAIAAVFGETPVVQPDLLEGIRAFFRGRGIEMPERNAKQAWLIPSAVALPNPVGTAPGWFTRRDGRVIAAMPGVPREMFRMWREQVVPRLLTLLDARAIRTVTINTIGIGESAAEQLLQDLVAIENPVVATYAKDDGVHVRVTAVAARSAEAEWLREATAAEVRRRLAPYIYAENDVSLPEALVRLLRSIGAALGVCDRGGGGRFAALLASHPESDAVLAIASLVPRTAAAGATELAELAMRDSGAPLGLGIAVDVTPVGDAVFEGTIAVALAGLCSAHEQSRMRSGYEDVQRRSALIAADLLRRGLITPGGQSNR